MAANINNCCTGEQRQDTCPDQYRRDPNTGAITPGCINFYNSYCVSDPDSIYCQTFKILAPSAYDSIMGGICTYYPVKPSSINSLKEYKACKEFCARTQVCDLDLYCADKVNVTTDNFICGCYYPASVYDNFYSDLNSNLSIPTGLIEKRNSCFFPLCASSEVANPDGKGICQELNLAVCIANTTINNSGSIVGDVKVKNEQRCSIYNSSTDTPSGTNWTLIVIIIAVVVIVLAVVIALIFRP